MENVELEFYKYWLVTVSETSTGLKSLPNITITVALKAKVPFDPIDWFNRRDKLEHKGASFTPSALIAIFPITKYQYRDVDGVSVNKLEYN